MPPNPNEPLAVEIDTYEQQRSELLKHHAGKFVVFKGTDFLGAWDTLEAAAANAARRFGRGPYLIRQVGAPRPTLPECLLYRYPVST